MKRAPLTRQQRRDVLESDLAKVAVARLPELRQIWRDRLGAEPPPLRSREIVRRMLAYRLQAAVHGDVSAAARRKLEAVRQRYEDRPAKPASGPRLRAGAKLLREWKGVTHEVWVTADGFMHDGQPYRSLSEVARAITGTRWNGPLFFGLRETAKEAA